jgi:hypothetical protein
MGDLIEFTSEPVHPEESRARSPVRARLAAAIETLSRRAAELTAAQQPATRLGTVIADVSRLEAELAELRAADQRRLGAWLALNDGEPRPGSGAETIACEKQLAGIAGDAAAARTALAGAEQMFQRCAADVRELQRNRDEALSAAAIEAAREFAEEYRAALAVALEHEAVLHGLRDELLRCGNRADALPGAMEGAAGISQLIADTKRSVAVTHNPQAARKLLATLVSDPDARLQKDASQ